MGMVRVVGAAVAVVAVILGMVFGAIQLLDTSTRAADITTYTGEREPIRIMELSVESVIDKGDGPKTQQAVVTITVMPADELPVGKPAVSGILTGSDGDALTVGTGSIEADLDVKVINGGEPQRTLALSHSGPEVEVRLKPDTVVYRDETPAQDLSGALPEGADVSISSDILVQQTVTLVGSAEEIGANTEIQVWGSLDGEVVVADVLVYRIVSE